MVNWEEALASASTGIAECRPIKALADHLKVPPLAVAGVAGIFFLAFALYGFGATLVCTVVGFFYPAFESYKALEAQSQPAIQFWLTYWVVFAATTLLENTFYYIVTWLPFYYLLKLSVLIWLFLPSTCGAEYVYRWVVAPVLKKYRGDIDDIIENTVVETARTFSWIPNIISSFVFAASLSGMQFFRRSLAAWQQGAPAVDVIKENRSTPAGDADVSKAKAGVDVHVAEPIFCEPAGGVDGCKED